MPNYRRWFVPGGAFFFTIVTGNRTSRFESESDIEILRSAIRKVKTELPFQIDAAVILPDHMHFLWTLPPGDSDYPTRIGKMKVEVTRALDDSIRSKVQRTPSKITKRESGYWQRRFWEHTIEDEDDFKAHLDYIHYNPVKHGYVSRAIDWKWSSFPIWVKKGEYEPDWGQSISETILKKFLEIDKHSGE